MPCASSELATGPSLTPQLWSRWERRASSSTTFSFLARERSRRLRLRGAVWASRICRALMLMAAARAVRSTEKQDTIAPGIFGSVNIGPSADVLAFVERLVSRSRLELTTLTGTDPPPLPPTGRSVRFTPPPRRAHKRLLTKTSWKCEDEAHPCPGTRGWSRAV